MNEHSYQHFVITRFNLTGQHHQMSAEEWKHWNQHRFELFHRFCLPSMISQEGAAFIWLIYFDHQTPEGFLQDIDKLNEHPIIRTRMVSGIDAFISNYIQDIIGLIPKSARWVITTRMDNDDILRKDAIYCIQSHFKTQDNLTINLSSGYTFNLENHLMTHYYYLKSPFISVVEDTHKMELQGVYARRHTQWEPGRAGRFFPELKSCITKKRNKVYILDKPYWIQIIHGKNISNDPVRGFPIFRELDLKLFHFPMINMKEKFYNLFKYYHFIWWKWYMKGIVLKIMYRFIGY